MEGISFSGLPDISARKESSSEVPKPKSNLPRNVKVLPLLFQFFSNFPFFSQMKKLAHKFSRRRVSEIPIFESTKKSSITSGSLAQRKKFHLTKGKRFCRFFVTIGFRNILAKKKGFFIFRNFFHTCKSSTHEEGRHVDRQYSKGNSEMSLIYVLNVI